jgi:endonuclease/exonuclease/phosphatase family metal-dependent hydrolase
MPVLRIDHVFVSPGVAVHSAAVAADPPARKASDHLPLVVDFVLEPLASPP